MLLLRGRISPPKILFYVLLAVLGSKGIVVKCTAAIFFRTANCLYSFQSTQSSKCKQKGIKLNLLFHVSYLNSNFSLTLGYLNPALNNPAQDLPRAK